MPYSNGGMRIEKEIDKIAKIETLNVEVIGYEIKNI